MSVLRSIPLALSLAVAALPALAVPTTATYTVDASGFTDIAGGTTPPADPVTVSFQLTFDPAAGDQFNYGTGLYLLAASVPITGPLAYDYDHTADTLTVGGIDFSEGIGTNANDVLFALTDASTGTPGFAGFAYSSAATSGLYLAGAGSVAVPEPATLVLFAGPLAVVIARRRRASGGA